MPLGALVPVLFHGSGGGSPPPTGLSITVTISSIDRTLLVIACSWSARIGQVGTASLTLEDPASIYDPEFEFMPTDGEVVQITVDGVLRWAGQITRVTSSWLGNNLGGAYQIEAQDWMHLPAREPINGILPANSVYDTLLAVTAPGTALNAQGITLSFSQAFGPTLGVITAPWWDHSTLLRHMATLSGYLVNITPAKVLELWAPGAKPSGITFSRANGNVIDATFEKQRLDYRNQQWVVFGPTGVQDATDMWSGDGVTQIFDLHYQPAAHPSPIVVNGLPFPVGVFGVDTMEWTFEANAGSGAVQYGRFRHTGTAIGAGTNNIQATFPSNFPNAVYVQDAGEVSARGRYGRVDQAPDITTYPEAVAYGNALIRSNLPRPKNPTIITRELAVTPGLTATAALPEIGLNTEAIFVHTMEVDLELEGSGCRPMVTLQTYTGSEQQGDPGELWLKLIGDGGASAGSGASSGGGGGGGGGTVITNGLLRVPFGGFRSKNPDQWRSTAGNGVAFDLPEGMEWSLVGTDVAGLILLRIHLMTDAGANGTVSARLFNESDNAAASDWTTGVTASSLTYVSVFCTLAATEKVYKVQLRVSGSAHATANVGYYNATLENRP